MLMARTRALDDTRKSGSFGTRQRQGEASWVTPPRKLRLRSGTSTLRVRSASFDTDLTAGHSPRGTSALQKAAGSGQPLHWSPLSGGLRHVRAIRYTGVEGHGPLRTPPRSPLRNLLLHLLKKCRQVYERL